MKKNRRQGNKRLSPKKTRGKGNIYVLPSLTDGRTKGWNQEKSFVLARNKKDFQKKDLNIKSKKNTVYNQKKKGYKKRQPKDFELPKPKKQ